MAKRAVLVFVLAACGGSSEPPPSCQDAVTSFYAVGCVFSESGQAIPASEMITRCREARADAPSQCIDELDDLQWCLATVANDTECAACSREQEAILTCE
jgi:hypothetical protein